MRFNSSMAFLERKKKKKQTSNSCMASFFNFFANRKFFSSKKKFLTPVRTPKKSPMQNTQKINLSAEGKKDEMGSTSTKPSKKRTSIVARLMGLDPVPVKPKAVLVASESVQTNLSSSVPIVPSPASKSVREKLIHEDQEPTNALETVQDKALKNLPLASKSVWEKTKESNSVQEKSSSESVRNIVWKPLSNSAFLASKSVQAKIPNVKPNASESVQNITSKPSNQNQNQPVKSPPRSLSPIDNVKLLEATVKVLDIGSQPVMTRFVNAEKFGSKLNDALLDLDELKDNNNMSNNSSCSNNNSVNNNKSGTKVDVSPKRGIGTGENKRELQKSPPNRRKSPEKGPLRQNNSKQNKSDQVSKDFIALNRSMLNNTVLRKKYLGVETKTENKNPVKKAKQNNNKTNTTTTTINNNNNNNNTNVNMKKMEGASEKGAGKELLIRKGAGQVSEKPPIFKNRAKSEKDEICIVSFTFSSPLKHMHAIRDFTRVYMEESGDGSVVKSSISSAVSQEDGNRKSPISILQASLLNNDSSSNSSTVISDLEMKEMPNKTEQNEDENENTSPLLSNNNINSKKNIISSSTITTKFRISSETEPNIQLFLQNILFMNPKTQQVSSFVIDATKTILETLFKTPNNSNEGNYLLKICVADFIIEHLDLVQNRVLDFGYNSWRKFRAFYTKEKIVKEIEQDILGLRKLGGNGIESLVEKDMANWDDLGLNFEIGVQIEKEIISQLIDEMVIDLV